jgi:hypothetical protein
VTAQREDRVRARGHRRQAVEARAAQQAEEDGLGLVVGGVTGHHVRGEHGAAGVTGAGLEVGSGLHVDPVLAVRRGPACRRWPGRRSVVGRVGTEAVVDVVGGDDAAGGHGEGQQRGRVGAAGDGAVDGVPGGGK